MLEVIFAGAFDDRAMIHAVRERIGEQELLAGIESRSERKLAIVAGVTERAGIKLSEPDFTASLRSILAHHPP